MSRPSFRALSLGLILACVLAAGAQPLAARGEPAQRAPLVPVIFVPGQPASLPSDFVDAVGDGHGWKALVAVNHFLTHLGTKPTELTSIFDLDLLAGLPGFNIESPTNALVDCLEGKGYEQGRDLFVAAHDWRLAIAPPETGAERADDGILKIGSTLDNKKGHFDTGLHYLTYWLDQAATAWQKSTGQPLQEVDVISHSEGYLLTRAYVSSTLYGGTYVDGDGSTRLPKIRHWIALGSPDGGVSGIYNLLQNNFHNSLGNAEDGSGIYPLAQYAYLAVSGLGQDIVAPDGSVLYAGGTVPEPLEFIQRWIPSLRAEMATYGFLDGGGDVNDDPRFRNDLLLDLNHGGPNGNVFGSPTGFVERVATMDVVYGSALPTLTFVETRNGAGGRVLPLTTDALAFGEPRGTAAGEVWFHDVTAPRGDSVLPLPSAEQSFQRHPQPNLTLHPLDDTHIDHDAEVSHPEVHELIVKILGVAGRR